MKDLKICVITQPLSEIKGGHILVSNLLEILEPLSNEIFVITGNFPENLILDRKIHIINVKSDDKKQLTLIRAIKYIFKQFGTTYNLLKISKNINIVIFFVGTSADVLPMLFSKLLQKKTVLIATGSASYDAESDTKRLFGFGRIVFPPIFRFLEKINYHLTDWIIVYSENIIDFLKLNKYKNKILSSGARFVDKSSFKKRKNLKDKRNLVGYIGRFTEEKGIMNFVKAIPLVLKKRKDLEFLIGGDGPLFDEIKKKLKNSGLNDKVELTGWIPHEEIQDYLNELKLVVLPSYTEGLPTLMLEAMACRTPVLATPVGAIPDIIKDEETGFILENNNPKCIAENIERVLNYPNLGEITENARRLVEKEFTYEAAVERYRKILENV